MGGARGGGEGGVWGGDLDEPIVADLQAANRGRFDASCFRLPKGGSAPTPWKRAPNSEDEPSARPSASSSPPLVPPPTSPNSHPSNAHPQTSLPPREPWQDDSSAPSDPTDLASSTHRSSRSPRCYYAPAAPWSSSSSLDDLDMTESR